MDTTRDVRITTEKLVDELSPVFENQFSELAANNAQENVDWKKHTGRFIDNLQSRGYDIVPRNKSGYGESQL